MNKETRKALEKEVARLIPRAINKMKNTYTDGNGYLVMQDFFLAIPFEIVIETVDRDYGEDQEKTDDDIYPSIFKYIGGYTKIVNSDADSKYLKVFITIQVPSNLESSSDAIKWVKDNLISNKDLAGENALLMVYMHEIMHILHKHLLPSVNAKFDAIIDAHSKDSKVPDYVKHKVKNFAEDFIINSMLLETATSGSALNNLAMDVKYKNTKIAFLYNPELAASQGETVETVIVKLMENMEIEQQGSSGGNSGNDGDQNQDQDGDNGEQQGSSGQGNGSSDGDGDQNQGIGTSYKIKYGDFEYEIRDMHDQQSGGKGQSGEDAEDVQKAVRDAMNQVANKMRGSGGASIAAKLGMPVEVTVDWLERLESDLFKEVRHRTNKVSSTWSRLKNKYRHVAPLPATVNYENVLNAVIVIDQSGSVGDLELRKINYVISKLVKRVKELQVLIHDDGVQYNRKFKRIVDRELEAELFKKRHACGGTSHDEVFEIIENEYNDKINEDFIVLMFSDMCSNIEELWDSGKFRWVDTIKTYLVSIEREGMRYVENVPAVKIDMETGEKI